MRWTLSAVAIVLVVAAAAPSPRAAQCGLVDGAIDGSSEPDRDLDGTPDCLDQCPTIPNDPGDTDGDTIPDACDCDLDVDSFAEGNDGECGLDCTLREAVALAPTGCTLLLPAGVLSLSSPLELTRSVSLVGAGASSTRIEYSGTGHAIRAGHATELVEAYLGALTLETGAAGLTLPTAGPTHVLLSNVSIEAGEPDDTGCKVTLPSLATTPPGRQVLASNSVLRGGSCGVSMSATMISSPPNTFECHSCLVTEVQGHGIQLLAAQLLNGVRPQANLFNSVVSLNRANGVNVGGQLTAERTLFLDNGGSGVSVLGGSGGSFASGSATITECEIAGNEGTGLVAGGGSGTGQGGLADVIRSTIHSNGAGVSVRAAQCNPSPPCDARAGVVSLTGSTVADNDGIGLSLDGPVQNPNIPPASVPTATVTSSTVTGNGQGVSIFDGPLFTAALTLDRSIVAANGTDCTGPATSLGQNFLGSDAGCDLSPEGADLVGGDPMLLPLGDHGGPTPTSPPALGSPLIDSAGDCDDADQRGVPRPYGDACDIGACEHAEAVLFDRETYDCNDVVELTVLDASIAGNGQQDVSVSSTTEVVSETIALPEVTSGHFSSTLPLVAPPPVSADGAVSVSPGDTLTAEYLDLEDGAGGPSILREATAAIACPALDDGACCRQDRTCSITTDAECSVNDFWLGAGSSCDQCPCSAACPAGSAAEGEAACGHNYADTYNGSCALAKPIAINSSTCGASGRFSSVGGFGGDRDWYQTSISSYQTLLTLTVDAGFPVNASIVDVSSGCGDPRPLAFDQASNCETMTFSAVVDPGQYAFLIEPASTVDSPPCPAAYTAKLTHGPASPVSLSVSPVDLSWSGPGPRYDVVRGDLASLLSSEGNFSVATQECLAGGSFQSGLVHALEPTNPGEGWWYLVRATSTGPQPQTYDSGSPSQVGSRDAEINAASGSCP